MNWEYFSKRRKVTLEEFVAGAKTLQEALMFFAVRSVNPPTDGSLQKLFAHPQADVPVVAQSQPTDETSVSTSEVESNSDDTEPKKNKWGIVESTDDDPSNDNA